MCRMHGAQAGAPTGERNGRYRHGSMTREARAERRYVADFIRCARTTLARTRETAG